MAGRRIVLRRKKNSNKETDEGQLVVSHGGSGKSLSSKTVYGNNLKKKYVDTFGQQPVKSGNYYDQDTRKKTSTHMSNKDIKKSLKLKDSRAKRSK